MVYTYLKYNGLIRCMSFFKDLLIIIRLIININDFLLFLKIH
jgi:hypothetical protein